MIMLADQSGDLLSAGAWQPSWVQIQARHSGELGTPSPRVHFWVSYGPRSSSRERLDAFHKLLLGIILDGGMGRPWGSGAIARAGCY